VSLQGSKPLDHADIPRAPSHDWQHQQPLLAERNSAPASSWQPGARVATAARAKPQYPRVSFAPLPENETKLLAVSPHLPAAMRRQQWRVEDYLDVEVLNGGYASEVFKATCSLSGQQVVLKVYHPEKLHEISRCQLLREARLHAQLHHPNIVQLHAAFQQEDGVVLVLEYADRGDLLALLTERKQTDTAAGRLTPGALGQLREREAVRVVVKPLLHALEYLHAQDIMHRDIKLENILFAGPSCTLKLADFGLCLNMREERSVTRAGTLDYMAPEVLKCPTKDLPEDNKERTDLAYNCSVDIWALGALTYELLHGTPPFSRMDRSETEKLIMGGWQPPFTVPGSTSARSFIYSCLHRQPAGRPEAQKLLNHPWIAGYQLARSSGPDSGALLATTARRRNAVNGEPRLMMAGTPSTTNVDQATMQLPATNWAIRPTPHSPANSHGRNAGCLKPSVHKYEPAPQEPWASSCQPASPAVTLPFVPVEKRNSPQSDVSASRIEIRPSSVHLPMTLAPGSLSASLPMPAAVNHEAHGTLERRTGSKPLQSTAWPAGCYTRKW